MKNPLNQKDCNKGKLGPIYLILSILSCMIGAGILVAPTEIMKYGFCGTLAWILASLCSLTLGSIFSINATKGTEEVESIPELASSVFGESVGFRVSIVQILYMCIAITAILKTMCSYLKEFVQIDFCIIHNFMIFNVSFILFFLFLILSKWADMVAAIATVIKLAFFSFTSIIGIITLSRVKFFYLPNIEYSMFRGKIEIIVLILFILIFVMAIFIGRKRNSETLANRIIIIAGIIFIGYMVFANADLIKKGLDWPRRSILYSIGKITEASVVALFAYAGLEFGAASPKDVYKPKENIPKATFLGILIASLVFILTYQCAVNNLSFFNMGCEKPVQVGLCAIIKSSCARLGFSLSIINKCDFILNKLISFIAIVGCCATCIALQKAVSSLLAQMICRYIVNAGDDKIRFRSLFIVVFILLLSLLFIFYIPGITIGLMCFSILHTYFYGVLVSLKKNNDIILNVVGVIACLILLSGCNERSIYVFVVISFCLDGIYSILSKFSANTNKKN